MDRRGRVEHVARLPRPARRVGGEERQRRLAPRPPGSAAPRSSASSSTPVDQARGRPGRRPPPAPPRRRAISRPLRCRTGRGQLRRPGEHVGAGREAAPPTGAVGDLLEPIGDRRIGADLALAACQASSSVRSSSVGRPGQRVVDASAVGTGRRVVDRRADQRMPERGPRWSSSTSPACSASSPARSARPRWSRGPHDQLDVPGRVGRGDQQPRLDRPVAVWRAWRT